MTSKIHGEVVRLISAQRWASLATLDEGTPLASMVAYAPERGMGGMLMYLSSLATHTRNLLAEPRSSLAIGEPDSPTTQDPQTLPRVSLQGQVEVIERNTDEFAAAWAHYVARFPEAAPRLMLGDFFLIRLVPERARYVGGFARALSLSGEDLRRAASAPEQ